MSALDGVNGTSFDSDVNQRTLSTLTSGQSIGLALTVEASFLSFGAIIVMFILIVRNLLRYKKTLPNGDWKLLRTPADIYMLSLFVYDLLLAIGGILDIRWAHDGIVTTGPYCTTQGVIKQIGGVGVALITLMLTIHTFARALWGVGEKARYFAFSIVALTWLFLALWVGIGNGIHKNFETPTPYWCWIGPNYNKERIAGHLSVDEEKWYKFHIAEPNVERSQRRATLGILFYPLAYSLMIIPLSISRWLEFRHKNVPSAAILFSYILFNLSGVVNVLLFLIVRPHLLLFTSSEDSEPVEPELKLTNSSSSSKSSSSLFPVTDGSGTHE